MGKAETKLPKQTNVRPSFAATAWADWPSLSTLRDQIDRLFEDFGPSNRFPMPPRTLRDLQLFAPDSFSTWSPSIDVAEKDTEYEVTADLPGIDEKNVELHVANGVLTIKGEKEDRKEETKADYVLSERRFGSFERRLPLPDGIDPDKITATMKKGVLVVTLPKTTEAQKPQKKIEVKSAA
jgi:HSP20 family protein